MSPDGRVWHEPRAAPLRAVRPNHARARTPRALAPPRRAHGPCRARILALGRIHGRTVWGGCTGGGLACRSLTIHTPYAIPHKWGVHFCLRHSRLHPPRQVSMTLKLSQLRAKLESGIEFYDGVFFLEFVEHINFTVSKSLRCTAPSKPTSNSLILASFCLRRSSRLVTH